MNNIEDLVEEFKPMIINIANGFYDVDEEDLYYAGQVGLYKAKLSFDNTRNTKFSTYAYHCIRNEMFSVVREYKPERYRNDLDENRIKYEVHFPVIWNRPILESVVSKLELKILDLMIEGYTIGEISAILKIEYKVVDNAMYRIKSKLKDKQDLLKK